MTDDTSSVKLPVTVTRNPGRGAGYTATYGTYPRDIEARGATAAEAKASLTAVLARTLMAVTGDEPSFARDVDGALWVAVPWVDGGSRWWRVTGDRAKRNSSSSSPAGGAFDSCVGMTILPG
jgi:hypothetical protein